MWVREYEPQHQKKRKEQKYVIQHQLNYDVGKIVQLEKLVRQLGQGGVSVGA